MKPIHIIIFLLFIAAWFATPAGGQDDTTDAPHIAYTKHFLRNYPKRLERALGLMPVVEGYSAINAVPTIVVAVIISVESSWQANAEGELDANGKYDFGLMQVRKGGVCAKGHDLSTPRGQIAAGTACLAAAYEACDGSLKQALTMYQSGSCVARTERTKQRIARRMRIIEKWSNK